MLNESRVLVTGGAGFIGSHLIEHLVRIGCKVTSIDNYLNGSQTNHIEGADYIYDDVCNINKALKGDKYDFIFHLGEYSRVEQSIEEPLLALNNIRKPFSELLEFWQKSQAKLIYAGSSTKFSDSGNGRYLSPYTLAKAQNTELLETFANWYDLKHAIVYFYNVYGGRETATGKYSTVIAKFTSFYEQGIREFPVTFPGTQTRNFTHIDDLIDGLCLVANSGDGDNFGIGADQAYSILEICEMFGCKPIVKDAHRSNRLSGPIDNFKLKQLGWTQKNNLKNHINSIIAKSVC